MPEKRPPRVTLRVGNPAGSARVPSSKPAQSRPPPGYPRPIVPVVRLFQPPPAEISNDVESGSFSGTISTSPPANCDGLSGV